MKRFLSMLGLSATLTATATAKATLTANAPRGRGKRKFNPGALDAAARREEVPRPLEGRPEANEKSHGQMRGHEQRNISPRWPRFSPDAGPFPTEWGRGTYLPISL